MNKTIFCCACVFALVNLSACGGGGHGGGGSGADKGPTFAIGITVTGLAGAGLVLSNNGGDALPVVTNGPRSFSNRLNNGAPYSISIVTQPLLPSQTCVVANASGTISGADVAGITVTCTTSKFSVGGTISGLSGAAVVQNNSGDDLTLRENGAFTFASPVSSGDTYNVSVLAQPDAPPQRCFADNTANGSVGSGPVTTIAIACETQFPRVAYSLNAGDGTISNYSVDSATGQLRARGSLRTGTLPSDSVTTSDGKRAFVVNAGSANVSAYARDGVTGELADVAGSPFATGAAAGTNASLAVHPNNRFVYVANGNGGNSVAAFSADSAGVLSAIAGSPFVGGGTPLTVTVHPSGKFAYVVNSGSKDVYTYSINQTSGALVEVPGSRVATGDDPAGLNLHPSARWAYVPNSVDGTITAYAVDGVSGKLTQIAGGTGTAGVVPRGRIVFHSSGRFLYVISNSASAGSVTAYAIAQTSGVLTPIPGSPFITGLGAISLAMDPAGNLMYVANQGTGGAGSIAMFRIDVPTGALIVLSSSISLQPAPTSVSVDPSGKFAYASSNSANQVYAYSIDATTGALIPLAKTPVMRTGDHPTAFVVDSLRGKPSPAVFASKFAYVANFADNTISQYQFNADTGALAEIGPAVVAGTGPRALVADLSVRQLFGTTQTDSTIASFAIDAGSGALSSQQTPLSTASAPVAIAADATRRFVFIGNSQVNTISGYRFDKKTRTLSATGSVANTSESPVAVTVDPTGRVLYFVTNSSVGRAAIDPASGALSDVSTIAIDAGATAIAVDPTSRFAYVTIGTNPGVVREFSINPLAGPSLGALTPVGAAGTGAVPRSVAVDPTGRFVYTADNGAYSISAFVINQVTGELTPNGAVAAGATPIALSIDDSGRFVYVTNSTANTVSVFAINMGNGTLTQTSAAPTGNFPVAIAIAGEVR